MNIKFYNFHYCLYNQTQYHLPMKENEYCRIGRLFVDYKYEPITGIAKGILHTFYHGNYYILYLNGRNITNGNILNTPEEAAKKLEQAIKEEAFK